MISVGDDLPRVMAYVRDTVIPAYESIGPTGRLAIAMMKHDLDAAAKAAVEGDVVGMVRAYASLKEYKL